MNKTNLLLLHLTVSLTCVALDGRANSETDSVKITARETLKKMGFNYADANEFLRAAMVGIPKNPNLSAPAVAAGDTNVLQLFLTAGMDVDTNSWNDGNMDAGITPLMATAGAGNTEAVEFLIEKGAKVDAVTGGGKSVLIFAIQSGSAGTVKKLIEHGANVNGVIGHGNSVLMFTAYFGNSEIASLLIEKGALVNATDEAGKTPLIYAAEAGNYEVAKTLLANHADPNLQDKQAITALGYAQKKEHQNVVALLNTTTTVGTTEIDGAFGLKLGDTLDATRAKADLVEAVQQANEDATQYDFTPQKPLPPFEHYSVHFTPKTHMLCAIDADYLEYQNAEQTAQLDVVIAALCNKYGKKETGWGYILYAAQRNGKTIAIIRSGSQPGQPKPKVALAYQDDSLEKLATSERKEIIKDKKDAEQTELQNKAKAMENSGL